MNESAEPVPPQAIALAERFAAHYPELRRMASAKLRRGDTLTLLGTTSLVHESFLRLTTSGVLLSGEAPAFWAYASQVMRSVIVDHARTRRAQRRGAGAEHVVLDTVGLENLRAPEDQVLDVHEALAVLEQAEPRLARVVEMQYFGGLTDAEIAQALGITDRTVRRDWNKARLLLKLAWS
jgi:RNA polymerase sigma factor (TIGR02999 family)